MHCFFFLFVFLLEKTLFFCILSIQHLVGNCRLTFSYDNTLDIKQFQCMAILSVFSLLFVCFFFQKSILVLMDQISTHFQILTKCHITLHGPVNIYITIFYKLINLTNPVLEANTKLFMPCFKQALFKVKLIPPMYYNLCKNTFF